MMDVRLKSDVLGMTLSFIPPVVVILHVSDVQQFKFV